MNDGPEPAYDPYWPFPQYDTQGKQLLPPKQTRKQEQDALFDEVGEATL